MDGAVEASDEEGAGLRVACRSEGKRSIEQPPEVVDVVLTSPLVSCEAIEGRVHVVEHGYSAELGRLLVRDARDDLPAVGVGDALVEESVHGEGVDVAWHGHALERRQLHADCLVEMDDLVDEGVPVVLERKQPVGKLLVERDPGRGHCFHCVCHRGLPLQNKLLGNSFGSYEALLL